MKTNKQENNLKTLFIAGTDKNAGKTTTCIGLISSLIQKGIYLPEEIGYIKPIGQEIEKMPDGTFLDKDAIAVNHIIRRYVSNAFQEDTDIKDINPVCLDSQTVKKLITGQMESSTLEKKIKESFKRIASGKKIVISEGSGYPGVGNVAGLSNAYVANLLDSKVILIIEAGIGNAIDELAMPRTFFKSYNADIKGVIVNKTIQTKLQHIKEYLTKGIAKIYPEIDIYGFLPINEELTHISMDYLNKKWPEEDIILRLNYESTNYRLNFPTTQIVAITEKDNIVKRVKPGNIVITAMNASESIQKIVEYYLKLQIGGLVLSCGDNESKEKASNFLKDTYGLPVLGVISDTKNAIDRIERICESAKIQDYEENKYKAIASLFSSNINVEEIIK